MKIEVPDPSNEQELLLLSDEKVILNENDFLFGKMGKIESYLLKGGDPNAFVLPNNYSLLYCAFIYKQTLIFLRLIRAGATLGENLVEKIELIMAEDENSAHAKFIFEVRQQLFASTEIKIKSGASRIQIASKNLEKMLIDNNRLIKWFYDKDIILISKPNMKKLGKEHPLKDCIVSLYELCCGKIGPEKIGVEKIEPEHKKFIRLFDNLYLKNCVSGILDQFDPNDVLEAFIVLFRQMGEMKFPLSNIQKLISLYILKEVIILNLEFCYTLNEKFHSDLESHLKNNYNNDLCNAFLSLNQSVNKLKNNSIYSSYFVLSKLAYKYPSHSDNSIENQLRDIVGQTPRVDKKKFKNFANFLAMEIRNALSLQFFEVCELKEFRKKVWEEGKTDRDRNAPNIVIYFNRLKALSAFVAIQISSQPEGAQRFNAFSLFIHAANNCFKLSQGMGPDIDVMMGIIGGLYPHKEECLPYVNKKTRAIYTNLNEILKADDNFSCIKGLLDSYSFPIPFLINLLFYYKLQIEGNVKQFDADVLSIIGEKIYSSLHRMKATLFSLQKNASTDLVFLLNRIKPDQSIISEYKVPLPMIKSEENLSVLTPQGSLDHSSDEIRDSSNSKPADRKESSSENFIEHEKASQSLTLMYNTNKKKSKENTSSQININPLLDSEKSKTTNKRLKFNMN